MRTFLLAALLLPGLAPFAQGIKKKQPASIPVVSGSAQAPSSATSTLANALAADTTYLSSADFSGTGSVSDPVRVKSSPFQSWLESLPGYSNGGNKYLSSDFTWKPIPKNDNSTVTLTAPSLRAAPAGSTAVSLSWSDVDNETAYLLQRSQDGISWLTVAQPPADATQFTNSGLSPATLYYYRVQAVGDNTNYSNSPFSSASATTEPSGGGGTSPDVLLFDVANAYNVQQHPDGPGTYYSPQGSGIAQAGKKLPAGADGLVYFQYLAGSGEMVSLGYTTTNLLQGYEYWLGGLILFGTKAQVKAYSWNGSTVDLGVVATDNHFYGFRRTGNVIEIVTSADQSNWTVLGYANYSGDDLYVQVYLQTTSAKVKAIEKNLVTY